MTSTPRYTSKAGGFRTAEEIARLRPGMASQPEPGADARPPAQSKGGAICPRCGKRSDGRLLIPTKCASMRLNVIQMHVMLGDGPHGLAVEDYD